jgi:hypothetical protein
MDRRRAASCRDDGSMIVGWLGRIALTLTLLGLASFEVLSVVVARVGIADDGLTAASAAQTQYQNSKNVALAYQAAAAVAESHGETIPAASFKVYTDGAVSFDITKTATTLLLYRWSRTAKYAVVTTHIDESALQKSGLSP